MSAIHCNEYGDVTEISLPPCIFPMMSQLGGYIFPVRRKWCGHKAQACICNHMHKITNKRDVFLMDQNMIISPVRGARVWQRGSCLNAIKSQSREF